MGVEVELIGLIGLKLDYSKYAIYKSKKDPEYIEDIACGYAQNKICLFQDYFPDNFIYRSDKMSGEYIYIGLCLFHARSLDVGIYLSSDASGLQKQINELIPDFNSLNIDYKKEDIKLHIFTHFW